LSGIQQTRATSPHGTRGTTARPSAFKASAQYKRSRDTAEGGGVTARLGA